MKTHTMNMTCSAFATACVLLAVSSSNAAAQRQSPRVSEAGVRNALGMKTVVANGIVTWDYWGIDLPVCSRTSGGGIECIVNVGNGVNDAHELCLVKPTLIGERAASGLPMSVLRVDRPNHTAASVITTQSDSQLCATYAPHDALNVILTSHSIPAGGARLIAVTLVEKWRGHPDSTASSAAELPISRVSELKTTKSR